MNRRELLKAAAALPLAQAALSNTAFAQDYPTRNITMIVPFPAGGQRLGRQCAGGTGRSRRLHAVDDIVVAGGIAGGRPAVRSARRL